jgi:hypothetical protein
MKLIQALQHDPALVLEWARKESTPRAKLQVIRGLADGLAERCDAKAKTSKPAASPETARLKPAGP